MKNFILLIAIFLLSANAVHAQYIPSGGSGGGGSGPSDVLTVGNDSVSFPNSYQILAGTNITLTPGSSPNTLTVSSSGGSASAGGTNGQIQFNSAGALGGFTASGGATINTSTGAVTLGNPGVSTKGGIESYAAVTNQWINTISTSGVPSSTQPAFSNISGSITLAQFPLIADNTVLGSVTSGSNVPVALTATQLTTIPNVFTSSLQGMAPASGGGTTNFLRADGSWAVPAGGGGSVSLTAGNTGIVLSPSTITGTGTISIGNPSASTLGGIESLAAVTSNWINSISTSGVPSASQPAFTDISGSATLAQLPSIAAYTKLANNTGSSAAPTAIGDFLGTQIVTASATLTATSPSYTVLNLNSASTGVAITLPAAATVPGRIFYFLTLGNAHGGSVVLNAADTYQASAAGASLALPVTGIANNFGGVFGLKAADSGNTWYPVFPLNINSSQVSLPGSAGGVAYNASGGILSATAAGTAGQLVQLNGSSAPSATSTPGSGTSLTTVTANHYLVGGSTPAFTAGTGAGTSPTITVTGTDKAGYVTVATGSSPTASAVVVTVTFNVAYGSTPASVTITDAASNDAVLSGNAKVWADQAGLATTGFTLNVGSTALAASTTYKWWYTVN